MKILEESINQYYEFILEQIQFCDFILEQIIRFGKFIKNFSNIVDIRLFNSFKGIYEITDKFTKNIIFTHTKLIKFKAELINPKIKNDISTSLQHVDVLKKKWIDLINQH